MDAEMGKRYRKPRKCPACNENDIWRPGICGACSDALEVGIEEIKRREEGKKEPVTIGEYFALIGNASLRCGYETKEKKVFAKLDRSRELVARILGGKAPEWRHCNADDSIGRVNWGHGGDRVQVHITKDQKEAMNEFLGLAREAIRSAYLVGFNYGRKLLIGLSDGSLTVKELNAKVEREFEED